MDLCSSFASLPLMEGPMICPDSQRAFGANKMLMMIMMTVMMMMVMMMMMIKF